MSGEIVAVGRSADGIATEIRVIVQQTRTMMAAAVIEIGKRLIEAQELVPHGEWGEYVTHSCGFSQRTAQAYMQLAANSANAQTIADLPYSKALALLALPEGKIEEFRAEHSVEDVSVRELKRQIAEYKDRLEKAADAGAAQQQQLLLATEENGALKQRLDDIDADYQGQLRTVDEENDRLRAELERALDNNAILGERASQAEIAAQNLRYDLDAAKKRPAEISEEVAAKLRAEGWGEGHREALGEKTALEGQVERLKKQLEDQSRVMGAEHREALAVKDEAIAELRRQLAAVSEKGASGSDAALLKNETVAVLLEVQTALNKMHGCYLKANTSAPALRPLIKAQAEKLIASLHSNFDIDYV